MTLLGDINAVTKQVRAFAWVLVYVAWSLRKSVLENVSVLIHLVTGLLISILNKIYDGKLFLNITMELGKSSSLCIDNLYVGKLSIFER